MGSNRTFALNAFHRGATFTKLGLAPATQMILIMGCANCANVASCTLEPSYKSIESGHRSTNLPQLVRLATPRGPMWSEPSERWEAGLVQGKYLRYSRDLRNTVVASFYILR